MNNANSHYSQEQPSRSRRGKDDAPLRATADSKAPSSTPVGWVTALRNEILADHRRFSAEPLHIFFDTTEIHTLDDWRHRILTGLRESKILLACLSPTTSPRAKAPPVSSSSTTSPTRYCWPSRNWRNHRLRDRLVDVVAAVEPTKALPALALRLALATPSGNGQPPGTASPWSAPACV